MHEDFGKRETKGRGICLGVICALLLLLALPVAIAGPTSDRDAASAVSAWLSLDDHPLGAPLGPAIQQVQTFTDDLGRPLYYVVYVWPSGYVIVPADDLIEPIIAFSPEEQYDPSPQNCLYALVTADLASRMVAVRDFQFDGKAPSASAVAALQSARAKWDMLLGRSFSQSDVSISSLPVISDLRVEPFLQSKWGQGNECGAACYNYYTPPNAEGSTSNYPTGCVATAMAQLMRYWQHPTAGVGTTSFSIKICGSSTTRSLRGGNGSGGPYNWSEMVLDPGCSMTDAEREAIGAICFDAGVAISTDYCDGGSGIPQSQVWRVGDRLKLTFQYSDARRATDSLGLSATVRNHAINSNLHASMPVLLGIVGGVYPDQYGHMVVCDGYGYDASTLYHHLNMGWTGSYDAWYNLPSIVVNQPYNLVTDVIYNVYVTGSGEIIAGRVTDGSGAPIADATVSAGSASDTTDARGIYALTKRASNTQYTVSVSKSGYAFTSRSVITGTSTNNWTECGNRIDIDFTGDSLPTATIGAPSPTMTDSGPVTYQVTWSEAVTGFAAADITLVKTGTASASEPVGLSGSGASYTVTVSGCTGDGTLSISIPAGICTDASANPNQGPVTSETVAVDNTPPTGSIFINGGALYTTSATVNLALSASDASTGVSGMRLRNDSDVWGDWVSYATSRLWSLSPGSGIRTVYVQFRDNVTNESAEYQDTIILDTTPAVNESLTPNTGPLPTGTKVTLTSVYSDPDGASNVANCWLLLNTAFNKQYAVYVRYDANSNRLYLRDDLDTTWGTGAPLGSSAVLQNSQCKLYCANTTVTPSGNQLLVAWKLEFKSVTSGWTCGAWMLVMDDVGLRDGWDRTGTLKISQPPSNASLVPSTGPLPTGTKLTLTSVYSDSDGSSNLANCWLLLNTRFDREYAVYVRYDANSNRLYVRDDLDTTWGTGAPPGSSAVLQNSQCKLYCADTTVTPSGNQLSIAWKLEIKSRVAGWTCGAWMQVTDDAGLQGLWKQMGTFPIGQPPANVSLSPNSGAWSVGVPRTISGTYSDPDGSGNLANCWLLINTTLDKQYAVYVRYDANTNRLYVRDDLDTSWGTGAPPGSSAVLQNSRCKLYCASTTVSFPAPDRMAVNWRIELKPTMAGKACSAWMLVSDDIGLRAGYDPLGAFTVQ